MNIVIVGCGNIGRAILSSLLGEGHNITAVDKDSELVKQISDIYDVLCVTGSGTDYDTLGEAGVEHADLVVTCTSSDELNMISCLIAGKMGAKHTIARIRNAEYRGQSLNFLQQCLELSTSFNPDYIAAEELHNVLQFPSVDKIEYFSRRSFEIIQLRLREDSPFCGINLSDLRRIHKAKFLICAVERDGTVTIPRGDFILQAGDRIELTAARTETQRLLRTMGILQKQARNVMILGASHIGFYVAHQLKESGTKVKLIDRDHDRCEQVREKLEGCSVICGDGTQQELLLQEGLRSMDAFCALTDMDEENILLAYYAASQGVPKVITKINRPELMAIAAKLGLDTIVSSRTASSNVVTRYARALQNSMGSNMESLYRLLDDKAEALEFHVEDDFPQLGKPLKDMNLKNNVLVAGISRGRRSLIPSGDDVILSGDRVVVFAAGTHIDKLSDILR